ncbi:MAG TPA: hypothetical protein VGG63_00845 [Steroidobacteraceae bacterium]|jgi:hypothetical protein
MAERRHESQEPDLRGLMVAGAIMSAAIALAIGVGLGLMAFLGGFERPLARAEHNLMPEPHLQAHPLADRQRYDAQERARMAGYQWVDRSAGIVRMPIGRAMQILGKRGRP